MKSKLIIPRNNDPKLAYLCGIFAGDGSINHRKNKDEYSIKCVGNPFDEIPFYEKIIKPIFKDSFGFEPKTKYYDNNTTYGTIIYSKKLVNFLTKEMELPLGKKYNNLRIPNKFKNKQELLINFIKGLFDTDGCICFKKKYKNYPYYPVISFSSKSEIFTKEIAVILKKLNFKIVETYNYKTRDRRVKKGFTIINRIELNGNRNLKLWMKKIGFKSPKHLNKIKTWGLSPSLLAREGFEFGNGQK